MTEVRNSEVTAYKTKVTWMHVYLNNNNNNNKFRNNNKYIYNVINKRYNECGT